MKVNYTIWKRSDFDQIELILSQCEEKGVDNIVVPIIFRVKGISVKVITDSTPSPFLTIHQSLQLLELIKDSKLGYILKLQFHPDPLDNRIQGLEPTWWPGWVDVRTDSDVRVINQVVTSFSEIFISNAIRITGKFPTAFIPAVELAALAPKLDWARITDSLRKKYSGIFLVYGANFWQPLRWYYRVPIWFLRLFGRTKPLLKSLLDSSGLYTVSSDKLGYAEEVLYRSLLSDTFWSNFDARGLSCYFYPSMLSAESISEAYDSYRYGWFSFSYPEVVMKWVGSDRLWITESGVLYNAPISTDRELVLRWFSETMKRFGFVDAFTIWEDTLPRIWLEGDR